MSEYLPVLSVAAFILAALVALGWPWLREKPSRDKAVTAVLVAFFLSMALYLHVGAPFMLRDIAEQQSHQREVTTQLASLQEQAASAPESAEAWAKLGALYIEMERYAEAAEALKQAVQLSEGHPQLILMYGKAQMMAADGKITPEARQSFEMAAMLMPENPDPRFLLAVERMQSGDREGAKEKLSALLPLLPEGAPLRARIQRMLQGEE